MRATTSSRRGETSRHSGAPPFLQSGRLLSDASVTSQNLNVGVEDCSSHTLFEILGAPAPPLSSFPDLPFPPVLSRTLKETQSSLAPAVRCSSILNSAPSGALPIPNACGDLGSVESAIPSKWREVRPSSLARSRHSSSCGPAHFLPNLRSSRLRLTPQSHSGCSAPVVAPL